MGQIEPIEFVLPDVNKAEFIVSHVMIGTFEQGARYVEVGLEDYRYDIIRF